MRREACLLRGWVCAGLVPRTHVTYTPDPPDAHLRLIATHVSSLACRGGESVCHYESFPPARPPAHLLSDALPHHPFCISPILLARPRLPNAPPCYTSTVLPLYIPPHYSHLMPFLSHIMCSLPTALLPDPLSYHSHTSLPCPPSLYTFSLVISYLPHILFPCQFSKPSLKSSSLAHPPCPPTFFHIQLPPLPSFQSAQHPLSLRHL